MTVGELIDKLKEFPIDSRVVIFPEVYGWSDIDEVCTVFEDFVAIKDKGPFQIQFAKFTAPIMREEALK